MALSWSSRACLIASVLLLAASACGVSAEPKVKLTPSLSDTPGVTFDQRSAIIDGKRQLILSGAIHYTRVLPEEWEKNLRLAKEMGLNTIQTYAMWNFHEPLVKGNLTWSGRANLTHFLDLATKVGLKVVLRIGPYVCGEYQYGGIPMWLRNMDNISCYRCSDPIWKREMQRIVSLFVDKVRSRLAPNGPIITLQVENEYNGNDFNYLLWAVQMARNLTTQVPWNLCHDLTSCTKVNAILQQQQQQQQQLQQQFRNGSDPASMETQRSLRGAEEMETMETTKPQVLCTINGFWMDEYKKNFRQPSPKWLLDQWAGNKQQPGIWTEDQGWFDQWGVAQRVRVTSDQAYGFARFFAFGGSWHNFYMFTGGNNFGRQSGGNVVTAYAPDTAVDFLGLKHETRFTAFQNFFLAIKEVEQDLLDNSIPQTIVLKPVDEEELDTEVETEVDDEAVKGTAAISLELETCTDTDPAHAGFLDGTQQFAMKDAEATTSSTSSTSSTGGQVLKNLGAKLCVGKSSTATTNKPKGQALTMIPCTDSAVVRWEINSTTFQYIDVSSTTSSTTSECLTFDQTSSLLSLTPCLDAHSKSDTQQFRSYSPAGKKASVGIVLKSKSTLCMTSIEKYPGRLELHQYGKSIAFLSNTDSIIRNTVKVQNNNYFLPNHTVVIVNLTSHKVLYNSSAPATESCSSSSTSSSSTSALVHHDDESKTMIPNELNVVNVDNTHGHLTKTVADASMNTMGEWRYFQETIGWGKESKISTGTLEQIDLTNDQTDYLWYTTNVTDYSPPKSGTPAIEVTKVGKGTLTYSFMNLTDSKMLQISILSCAMGMQNTGVGPQVSKGILGSVTLDGHALPTTQRWDQRWFLEGEAKKVFSPEAEVSDQVQWNPVTKQVEDTSQVVWFKTNFDLDSSDSSKPENAQRSLDTQSAYAIDLSSMNKGVAYVNGFNLGRYWLRAGTCPGTCAPPVKSGHCYMHYKNCNKPTQSLYYIPSSLLKPTNNLLVLFEETANTVQQRDLTGVKIVQLQNHPSHD